MHLYEPKEKWSTFGSGVSVGLNSQDASQLAREEQQPTKDPAQRHSENDF